jgi:quercetin dioxygenase-like cupin family protein
LYTGKGHDFHKHANQEEVILVIADQIEQWIARAKRVLGPGDTVFVAPNTVHASFNIGDTDANIIAIFGPSVGDNGLEMIDEAP